jgi:hypothetical protein
MSVIFNWEGLPVYVLQCGLGLRFLSKRADEAPGKKAERTFENAAAVVL